jgi:hypothetical protein
VRYANSEVVIFRVPGAQYQLNAPWWIGLASYWIWLESSRVRGCT